MNKTGWDTRRKLVHALKEEIVHRSKIEWCRNPDGSLGWVWNPLTGCLNHVNGMCKGGGFPCYAYRLANGRLKHRYLANNVLLCHDEPDHEKHHADPFYPRFWEERILEPWDQYARYRPKGIFVCDMSDLFGIGIPEVWTQDVLHTIRNSKGNRFYLLTKRPENLIKWSPFSENCWVGVTATNEVGFQSAMKYLPYVQAKVRYLSIEPFLGRILTTPGQLERYVDWLIVGAQTRPTKLPEIGWVKEIVEAADKAGTPVFLKNNLWPLGQANLRQEMPEVG